jgi:glucosamine-phosphate N-acetyltransferase
MSSDSHIIVRKLEVDDFGKGFVSLLAQLTTVGDISQEEFTGRWWELNDNPDYYIAVAEDSAKAQLLGTAALIIERKFVHSCGKVGHIEDVVVDGAARGHKLGQRLIDSLVQVAREQGCYKVILDCAEHNIPFYEKCGLSRKEVQMVKYLDR